MYRETAYGNTAKSNFIQAIDKNINEYKLYQNKCSDLDKTLSGNLIKIERENYKNQQIFFQIRKDLANKAKTQLNLKLNYDHNSKKIVPRYFDLINLRQSNSASSLRAFLIRSIKKQETLSNRSLPINGRPNKSSFTPSRSESIMNQNQYVTNNNNNIISNNNSSVDIASNQLPAIINFQPKPKTTVKTLNQILQKSKIKSKSYRDLPNVSLQFLSPGSDYSNGSLSDIASSSIYSTSNSSTSLPSKYKSIRRERANAKTLNEIYESKATIIKIQKKYDTFGNTCTKYFKHIHDK